MLGVDRQRADCEALTARLDWRVGGVYVDDDVSAFGTRRRPEYERLLADLGAGRLDAVIAWHPDRLHRSPREVEAFIDLVNRAGARVATVRAGEYDLASASGRMTARVVGAVARHESEQKSERLRHQREQSARAGLPNGGPRPFGYEPGGLTIRRSEAGAVREATRRVLRGGSLRSIAVDFNARGIRTSFDNRWTVTSLRLMLLRPRYAGLRVHRGQVIGDAAWPAIITRTQHEQLSQRLVRTPRATPARRSLLAGLLRCGRCGGPMGHQTRTEGQRRYYCLPEPDRRGCGRVAIHAQPLEDHLIEAFLQRHDTAVLGEVVRAVHGIHTFDDDTIIRTRLGTLADLYADGAITAPEWSRARRRLQERLLGGPFTTPDDPHTLDLGPPTPTGLLRIVWPQLDTDQRRKIVHAAIQTITVAPASSPAHTFNSQRLTIEWR
jgi:DNA invertase Pin-like site-specific DNA recombinase